MNIQAIIGGITLVTIITGSTISANNYFATNNRVDEIEITINADRRGMLMSLQQKLKQLEKKLEKLT